MIEKKDVEFFGDKKVVVFSKKHLNGQNKKFVNCGFIKHVGSSVLIIEDVVCNNEISINFSDIEELRKSDR